LTKSQDLSDFPVGKSKSFQILILWTQIHADAYIKATSEVGGNQE
jgi:hypothetical protein